jgi:hypothetical protein
MISERIAFIIDCYQTFYDKMNLVETRLGQIESQNAQILRLMGSDVGAPVQVVPSEFKEISDENMKNAILDYYKTHKIVFPSDIALEMRFDLKKVVSIINDLIASGEVEEVRE